MTPQDLKNSILQLAIQGKLVEQRPEEGSAEDPFKPSPSPKSPSRHSASRPPSPVIPEDAPFDIPESWRWVRLGDVVANHGQKTPQSAFSYIDIGSIDNKHQRLSDRENIVHPRDASPRARKIVEKGDVLYATVRPYLHNVCIVDRDFTCEPIASTGFAVMACADCLDAKFLFHFLLSPDFDRYANSSENAKGVAYPAISDKRLYNAPIPLPPLPEQRRIVAKIEELQPLIDRYAEAWTQLEAFNKRFPEDMQKSLLQLAIQGKLVEQRPEEGTGEELYRKILATKNTKKTKKEKPLPPITDDEIPFDIPESWKWVRLASATDMLAGFAFKSTDFKPAGKYRLLRGINLGVNCIRWKDTVYLDSVPERLSDYRLQSGDVLIGLDRPWISDGTRVAIFDDLQETYLVQRVLRLRESGCLTGSYIALLLHSSLLINSLGDKTTGISVPHISPGQVGNLVVPLPPLAEQKRIVAKLEELLPLCESLNQ